MKQVAVIGAGVSGLTAAYALRGTHDVTLYEALPRLGGHADTHDVLDDQGNALAIDTGFLVHNERTYPTLLRLFAELGVATQPTEMSMSVRCGGCGLEYAGGKGLGGLFAQRRRAVDPRHLRMLSEVTRFHRSARELLDGRGCRRADTAGVPRRRAVLAAFRESCRHAAGLSGVVLSAGGRPALSGPLSVRVPRQPRDAHGQGCAYVAHGRRGLADVRRARSQGTQRGPDLDPGPVGTSDRGWRRDPG